MPPRKRPEPYTPPEPTADLDATSAAMVHARIIEATTVAAARDWWCRWEAAAKARRRALSAARMHGRTDARAGKPAKHDRATVDPVGLEYLRAFDAAMAPVTEPVGWGQ